MDQNQIDKTLYIDKFKEQVELLFNLYEHPKYLELLDGKKDLLNKLQTELKNIITNTLVKPKDNSEQISLKKRIVAVIDDNFKNSNYTLLSALGPILETEFNFYSSNSSYKELQGFIIVLKKNLQDSLSANKEEIRNNIQARIRREPVISQEDTIKSKQDPAQIQQNSSTSSVQNDHIYTKLDDIIGELWTSFSKSLLEGEFIKDAEYSKKLEKIITNIKDIYDTSLQKDTIYLHPILPFIHELCQELSYMCLRIGVQIEKPQEEASCKRKVFHAPVSDLARKLYAGGVNSGEMLKARLFHDLGKKLIEMTRIDISGIIDDQAIPPLLLLYKQCERLKDDNKASLDFPTDTDIKAIFKAICAKTSLLLFQSFYKPVVRSDKSSLLNKNESIKNPYTRAKKFEILYEGNRYYVEKKGEEKKNLLYDKINEFESLIPFEKPSPDNSTDNSTNKPTDIQNYDDYVTEKNKKEKGKKKWKEVLQNEKKQKEILEGLLNDPKNINAEHLIYFRSLDLLLALMKRLKKMKEEDQKKEEGKENYNTSKYAQALGYLLKCFSEWIQSYKDFVSAEQKRNEFEDSFYVVMEVELKIFISSYGCKLIHTPALQGEVYPKYNWLYMQWISEAQDEAVDRALININIDVSKRQEEAKKETTTAINKVQADSRRESISTLSIFVALLSFISGGINILQGAASLADYLILTSTLYIFIASIIFFLYFKGIEGDKQEKELNWSKIVMLIATAIAIRVVVVGLCIKYYNKTEAQDSKGGLEMNVKVENFNQTSPNVKQITNSSSDSSKTSDVIKGDQEKKKTENASKEQQKSKEKAKTNNRL
ncbi:hypothetical protein [Alloprevotella tannerae]|uniref:hypothetical protein n=1 Tax=Alloprevotella tannerae TaxID=76122 RepID=UPI0028D8C743|nr:hypothetical protein [Alloprevotella tannerae]